MSKMVYEAFAVGMLHFLFIVNTAIVKTQLVVLTKQKTVGYYRLTLSKHIYICKHIRQ